MFCHLSKFSPLPNSLFPMPNSQSSIPNPQLPILNSQSPNPESWFFLIGPKIVLKQRINKQQSYVSLAESFYCVNYGSSSIMSKSSSNNLSNENKHCCFCCLQDKTWIKMPKWTIFVISLLWKHRVFMFSLLRFFDVIIDDQ